MILGYMITHQADAEAEPQPPDTESANTPAASVIGEFVLPMNMVSEKIAAKERWSYGNSNN